MTENISLDHKIWASLGKIKGLDNIEVNFHGLFLSYLHSSMLCLTTFVNSVHRAIALFRVFYLFYRIHFVNQPLLTRAGYFKFILSLIWSNKINLFPTHSENMKENK